MGLNRLSARNLWKTLDLVDDFLATGFSRSHPDFMVADAAETSEPAGARPGTRESPRESPSAETGSSSDRAGELSAVASEVSACVKCGLSVNRTRAVPGEGSIDPPVLFVGEAPGEEEDRTGRPFVGPAGRYLDTWIPPTGLSRESCFIANCVKCRPPQNREPRPEEIASCLPYLERQIDSLRPRAICCLGRIAAHTLLGTEASLGDLRGRLHRRKGITVIVTYHPSAVLRDKSLRKPVWEDLKLLMTVLAGSDAMEPHGVPRRQ